MLFWYEVKKILKNRVNLIAMLVGYIIIGITAVYPVLTESEYIFAENRSCMGMEAIAYNRDRAAALTDYLTEEQYRALMQDIHSAEFDLTTDDGYFKAGDRYGDMLPFLGNGLKDITDESIWVDALAKWDPDRHPSFYERRRERIEEYLNMDFSYGNFTEAEKEYWMGRADKIETPYKWGDTFVPKHYQTVIALSFYLAFAIAIFLSGVFAREKEDNTEGMILSTGKGQKQDVYAKIFAALCVGQSYVLLAFILSLGWVYFTLGTAGFDLPVQLLGNSICYDMNLAEFLLLQLVISLVITMFTSALSCFLSAFTGSGVATVAVMVVLLLGPAFIPFSKSSNLFNHINSLALVRIMDLREVLKQFMVYRFGGLIINLPTMGILVYVIATGICILLIGKCYVASAMRK